LEKISLYFSKFVFFWKIKPEGSTLSTDCLDCQIAITLLTILQVKMPLDGFSNESDVDDWILWF